MFLHWTKEKKLETVKPLYLGSYNVPSKGVAGLKLSLHKQHIVFASRLKMPNMLNNQLCVELSQP